ncbi:unnamed protein product [Arabidopsis thaliana]|nr:unnamed protein product [Arabidopsis thaliana]VYS47397.1 unnamed protein product [Arabidopsis thaliana]
MKFKKYRDKSNNGRKNRERRTHKRYHNQRSRVERGRRKSKERVESLWKTKRRRGRETLPEETLTYGDWNNKGEGRSQGKCVTWKREIAQL